MSPKQQILDNPQVATLEEYYSDQSGHTLYGLDENWNVIVAYNENPYYGGVWAQSPLEATEWFVSELDNDLSPMG